MPPIACNRVVAGTWRSFPSCGRLNGGPLRPQLRCYKEHVNEDSSAVHVARDVIVDLPLSTTLFYLAAQSSAWASSEEAGVAYNASEGEDFLKNAAGTAYVALVGLFLFRVLKRRAKRAREQKLSAQPLPFQQLQPEESFFDQMRKKVMPTGPEAQREATALDAFLGAAQAGALGFGLFIFSTKVSSLVNVQALPDGYTARNITITVRTLIQGLSWLATFIFCANAIGLFGLSVQMFLFPDSIKADEAERAARRAAAEAAGPQLPKVAITAKPEEIRRAFQTAESMGKKEGGKEAAKVSEARTDSEEAKT